MVWFHLAMLAAMQAAEPAHPPVSLQPLGSWIRDNDYPAVAIRRNEQGIVAFTLEVGADGRPTGCTVEGGILNTLDRVTCEIMQQRARFQPARDAQGQAVPGQAAGRIRWVLPDVYHGYMLGALGNITIVRADAAGTLHCTASDGSEAPPPGRDESCDFLEESRLPSVVRRLGRETTLTMLFQIVPDGASGPSINSVFRERGDPVIESLARVSIGENGAVTACRQTTRRIVRRVPGLGTAPELCSLYEIGAPFPYRFDNAPGALIVWVISSVSLRDGPPPS